MNPETKEEDPSSSHSRWDTNLARVKEGAPLQPLDHTPAGVIINILDRCLVSQKIQSINATQLRMLKAQCKTSQLKSPGRAELGSRLLNADLISNAGSW